MRKFKKKCKKKCNIPLGKLIDRDLFAPLELNCILLSSKPYISANAFCQEPP